MAFALELARVQPGPDLTDRQNNRGIQPEQDTTSDAPIRVLVDAQAGQPLATGAGLEADPAATTSVESKAFGEIIIAAAESKSVS